MSKTNYQDPGSSEIISPIVSGMQEALGKIEHILDLDSTAENGIALSEVYISAGDRYRIYQAPEGKRNWLADPAPVIKKNGDTISSGFSIEYSGGAIVLDTNALETDAFTADTTYTKNNSTGLKIKDVNNDTTYQFGIDGTIGRMYYEEV
jgi:hypothetical protein